MKPRNKALSLLLVIILLLPMLSAAAPSGGGPEEVEGLLVEEEILAEAEKALPEAAGVLPLGDALAIAAASVDLLTIPLENWKIAPESAVTFAPWKTAGVGDASAPTVSSANWIPAKVPGTVLGNVIDAGAYDDVFEPNNEGEADVYFNGNQRLINRDDYAGWWWYSYDFVVTPDQADDFFNLNLNNMSYQGEVFVNGEQVVNKNTNIRDIKELMNKESVDRATYPEWTAFSNPPPPYSYNTNNIGLTTTEVTNPSNINFGRPLGAAWRVQSDGAEGESGGIVSSVNMYGHGDWDKYSTKFIGAFRTYDVDITDYVEPGVNTIRIRVKRMYNVADFGPFWHDWHPTTPDNNMGLTGDASLNITGPARISNPLAATVVDEATVTKGGNGDVDLSFYVNVTNMSSKPISVILYGVIRDPDGEIVPGGEIVTIEQVPAGAYNWDLPLIEDFFLEDARLWWTNGAGEQPLYTIDYMAYANGVYSDTLHHRFGIRELRHSVNNSTAAGGYTLQTFINGQPIVMAGGGFGALDHYYRMDELVNKNFVEAVKTMGHNMWRDEGKFYSEDLYSLMDEAGLLLMTGFMCCDRNEVSNATGWSSVERMLIYEYVYSQMRIMRRHASGWAFLSGSDRAKSAAGNTQANPSGVNMERKMWEIAGRVRWFQHGTIVASAVAGGSAITGASTGVTMGGGYDTVPAGKFYQGISPTDGVGSGTGAAAYGGMVGFYSETAGGMGIPVTETLKKVLPKENWWPYNQGNGGQYGDGPGNYNIWNYLAARGGTFETLDVSNVFVEYAFGPASSLEEYVIKAQMFQYEEHRGIHEVLHLERFNKATGFINWMLNSPRPSTFWNQIDFYVNPIGNSFGSTKGCTPVHIAYDQYGRKVFAMNNTREDIIGATATLKMYDIYGNQINETLEKTINLYADGATFSGDTIDRITGFTPVQYNGDDWFEMGMEPVYTPYTTANATGQRASVALGNVNLWNNDDLVGSQILPTTDVYFVSLELRDSDGELFSRNDYAIGRKRDVISSQGAGGGRPLSQAADLTQVNMLPKVELVVTRNPGGYRDASMWEQTVTITNPTLDIAFGIEMKAYTDGTKAQMTPVNYSDNLITLFPGESRTITIWHYADNLGGKDAFIGVDCYNNIISNDSRNQSRGNVYVPGDPDSAEWAAWGLPPQTQTSATTNLARNVGSSVATVASNSTAPNAPAANTGNAPTRITNADFIVFANNRAHTVFDSVLADGSYSSTTGYAQIPSGSAHYINLGSAQTFDKVITRWNENVYHDWGAGNLVARGVPNMVRLQISAATGATADWNDLLVDEVYDNTEARSFLVTFLLDEAVTARHIRTIPSGTTGASDAFGAQIAAGRLERGPGYNRDSGWDVTSGRLNDQVLRRAALTRFSLTAVELYHTYTQLSAEFLGTGMSAKINGRTIAQGDANNIAYAFFNDKINIELDQRLFVYLDGVDVSDKTVAAGGKFTLALDATDVNSVITFSETNIPLVATISAGESAVVVNTPVEFFVSIEGMKDVNLVSLEITYDSDYVDLNLPGSYTALNGFTLMSGSVTNTTTGSIWTAHVVLMVPADFISSVDDLTILRISGVAKGKIGDAKVNLKSIQVMAKNSANESYEVLCVIGVDEAVTSIVAKPPKYSQYDLNKNGVIDALDLSIAVYFYQKRSTDADWDDDSYSYNGRTAKDADVNGNGIVNLADLIEIMANYGTYDPYDY